MARGQGAALDRKKLMADPIMVTTIVVLITFLTLFILYPLAILLVDSFYGDGRLTFDVFKRIFAMPTFTKAIGNTETEWVKSGRYNSYYRRTVQKGKTLSGMIFNVGFVHTLKFLSK